METMNMNGASIAGLPPEILMAGIVYKKQINVKYILALFVN